MTEEEINILINNRSKICCAITIKKKAVFEGCYEEVVLYFCTQHFKQCKRRTRHLSRVCTQHRGLMTEEEVNILINNRSKICCAITKKYKQCSRDATRNFVLHFCTQHFKQSSLHPAARSNDRRRRSKHTHQQPTQDMLRHH